MTTLVLTEGLLTPSCSKSHITYSFNVPKESSRLDIHFSYDPKKLDHREKSKELICEGICNFVDCGQERYINEWESFLPVQNLLTLSVDDGREFRGCVHRQSPEQHLYIAGDSASPGLIPGTIPPGQWKVTISVHAVVTDVCRYKLHVMGAE